MKETRICEYCGQPFEATNGMQRFCKRQHYDTCAVCGTLFEIPASRLVEKDRSRCCSRKCSAILRKQTNEIKYGGVAPACSEEVRKKMQSTNVERYGVEHAAQAEVFKQKSIQTSRDRYGVDNHSQTDEYRKRLSDRWKDEEFRNHVLESQHNTNMERYGVPNTLQSEEVRSKIKESYRNKTGYDTPFANPDVQKKYEETNLRKYGVRRPLQSDEIMNKMRATNIENRGVANPMQDPTIVEKVKQTCLDKYGNTCYLQSEQGLEATRNSMRGKYGSTWFSQSREWKSHRMVDPSKIDNLISFRSDPANYISSNFGTCEEGKPSLRELSASLGISETSAGQLIIQYKLQDMVRYTYSYMEEEVYNLIHSLDSDIVVERNTHRLITPYELDLYLPQYKIGIECNPTSTHNSSIDLFTNGPSNIAPSYHLKKTKLCEDSGIFLFHIFGPEWTHSRPIIESMIRNMLGRCNNRVYARNTSVVDNIPSDIANKFLNDNHRQGAANSSVRFGLYLGDELVSLMTFGEMRTSIGTSSKEDLSDCWELVRFCSKLDTSVVGGASKLFKHFLKIVEPKRVRSFSDRAHTRGNLYQLLGFQKVRCSDPGYTWVDSVTDVSYHRVNAQKQNIKKFLNDDTIDLSKTERQIMEEHGFLMMYDCGTVLWEYNNSTKVV